MRARVLTRRGHAASVGFVRKIVQAARAAMAGSRWDLYHARSGSKVALSCLRPQSCNNAASGALIYRHEIEIAGALADVVRYGRSTVGKPVLRQPADDRSDR
jgi:hypothetical protein